MTQYIRIYRVEHPTDRHGPYGHGEGPSVYYAPNKITKWAWNERNPILQSCSSASLVEMQGWKCCFESMTDLQTWFRNKTVRKWLVREGFKMAVYQVYRDSVIQDTRQSIFDPTEAILVEYKSL